MAGRHLELDEDGRCLMTDLPPELCTGCIDLRRRLFHQRLEHQREARA